MRKTALALTAVAALLAGPALQARDRIGGEERLDKLLAGRIAEKPVSCIPLSTSHDMEVIDKTALVFGRGRVIYVNRPRDARSLDNDDVLVTNLHTSQLCRLDVMRQHDRSSLFFSGFVGLEDFVPYRRVARND